MAVTVVGGATTEREDRTAWHRLFEKLPAPSPAVEGHHAGPEVGEGVVQGPGDGPDLHLDLHEKGLLPQEAGDTAVELRGADRRATRAVCRSWRLARGPGWAPSWPKVAMGWPWALGLAGGAGPPDRKTACCCPGAEGHQALAPPQAGHTRRLRPPPASEKTLRSSSSPVMM